MWQRRSFLGPIAAGAVLVVAMGTTTFSRALGATTTASDVGVLAATAGCGKTPSLRSGTFSIQSGGQNRSYILRVPDNYDRNRPYRLIFGLHWLNGTAANVSSNGWYGLLPRSNNSTIFVAPQGINNGWANSGGRDVTLVDDIMRLVENDLCVETTQRFALGWSFGGAMSYALACARPTVFRAVAVYSGANLSGCSGGTQPVAYFGIHGIFDSVLNISQGRALRDTFVRNNGCTAQNPREPTRGSGTHITTVYTGCRSGFPVQWAAFDGDHTPSPVDGSGPDDSRTWTSGEVWSFFTQFQSPPSSSSSSVTPSSSSSSSGPSQPPGCRVGYDVNSWNTGLTANITITNTGNSTVNGWALAFTLPGGQTITNGWNATYAPTSGAVTARNVGHNPTIAPAGSTTVGFQATHTGNTAEPTSFILNGTVCAIA